MKATGLNGKIRLKRLNKKKFYQYQAILFYLYLYKYVRKIMMRKYDLEYTL